ncbi:MAG: Asp-tRNA(Asn)/Glu-tRNA(Gln) amidotransferase subunit GatB [Acidobacteriota bacterium]
MEFEPVIGLEVHAQLLTQSKIFCSCSTRFGAPPNSNTCPVCLGLPGALPVLNRQAVAMAVRSGLALGCRINRKSLFARKNYFYPDLPKGYQISQYDLPLAAEGIATISLPADPSEPPSAAESKRFRINRIHLEDDAGKSIHDQGGTTQVNLNRTGTPLIEIVTEADFRSSGEAYEFLSFLRQVLLYLEVCDGNMEEGSLRCDANVSIRPVGAEAFGTKTEIKNLNSFRFVRRALDYEIERQKAVLLEGGRIIQETRLWNEQTQSTEAMRSKEEAHDYRYFPEPDLLPLVISQEWLDELQESIPELPDARKTRLEADYGLDESLAGLLTQTREFSDYFETAARKAPPVKVANWMIGDLTRELKRDGREIADCPIAPHHLAELVELIDTGAISGKTAKDVFSRMYQSGEAPARIVEREGLRQISSEGELDSVVDRVLDANPDKVEQYRGGKEGLIGFFVGQVMRETGGQANPKLVNELLRGKLKAKS